MLKKTDDLAQEGVPNIEVENPKVLKSPALLLVMAGNVPAPMAVYITYTYLPTVITYKRFLDIVEQFFRWHKAWDSLWHTPPSSSQWLG